jgi:hypothetical protein
LQKSQIFGLAALAVGVVFAILSSRIPKRGWIGVALLVVAALAWALIDAGESSKPSRLPMFLTFLTVAPFAVVYSFRARRSAPDHVTAFAAFIGSFIVAGFLLFMLAGILYSLFAL